MRDDCSLRLQNSVDRKIYLNKVSELLSFIGLSYMEVRCNEENDMVCGFMSMFVCLF